MLGGPPYRYIYNSRFDQPPSNETVRHSGVEKDILSNDPQETPGKYLLSLTADQIEFIRQLRVDRGLSWRAIAHACYEAWDAEAHKALWFDAPGGEMSGTVALDPSNQSVGLILCDAAAQRLGENPDLPPWQ